MKIHVWCPGAYDADGGIEAYSAALVRALGTDGNHAITVLAKHDRRATLRARAQAGVRAFGTGDIPLRFRTPAFAALLAMRGAIDRPDLIITTHLNFSPVAAWLKRRFRIPFWSSLHGIEAWNLEHAARVSSLHAADLLLPVSGFTRDHVMTEQRIPTDRHKIESPENFQT